MKTHRRKIISYIVAALLGTSLAVAYYFRTPIRDFIAEIQKPQLPPAKTVEEMTPLQQESKKEEPQKEKKPPAATPPAMESPPSKEKKGLNLAVPFTSQAPHQNWALPYQEACEEASMLMVDAFYKKTIFTPESADEEIKKLVAWQERVFGYYKDTTAEEVAEAFRSYFGMKHAEVDYEFTFDDIRAHIAAGHPVIVPAAGRLLPNPNFREPGPVYHMLVIKGFTDKGLVITNDPGTRKGKDFLYTQEALMNAIHDWNRGDVLNGKKAMIVAYP